MKVIYLILAEFDNNMELYQFAEFWFCFKQEKDNGNNLSSKEYFIH